MLMTILVLLFVLVFVILAWRIVSQAGKRAPEEAAFVCPECDEVDCVCHQKRP